MRLLYFFVLLLTACTTQKSATTYFDDHPTDAAKYCAEKFPVGETIGKPEITFGIAENKDHRTDISGIDSAAKDLVAKLQSVGPAGNADSFAKKSELIDAAQRSEMLAKRVNTLLKAYKPCAPDTLRITLPVYRVNTAQVEYFRGLYAREQAKNDQLQEDRDNWKSRALKCYWGIGIFLAGIGLVLLLKIKRVLP